MQNCCKKWEDVKVTPKQLKKIAQDTKDFLTSEPKKYIDDLSEDNRKVLIPDVKNQTWLVHLGKFYEEMIRLKRKAEKTIGILSTGLNTYICTQPIAGCTTACVGGGELLFYMPFILAIKSDDVAFVYGHELYHTYQNIPERIISHVNKNDPKALCVENGKVNPTPSANSIMNWYRDNHTLINIAADYEDNYILQRVGLADEEFLTGGDPDNPRFCYRKEYGRKSFEDIFDELKKTEAKNRATEKEYKPKKKTIINGPVIIEDPDKFPANDSQDDINDDNEDTKVINDVVHATADGKEPKKDPGEVEINGPIIDNRTKKPEEDPFPEDDENNDSNSSSENDSEGSKGGSKGGDASSGGGGNAPSSGKGGGDDTGRGKSKAEEIKNAKKLSNAIDEWIRRRTGVSEWNGGLFSGTITGTLSPAEVERCRRKISTALSSGTTTKLKGAISHACETIVSGINKQGRWGSHGHLWKKEVRPYSKNNRADAKINLVYMFDNSGSMGAPLICSLIDCLIAVWKEYEDVVEKIVMIPMRDEFQDNGTDVIICSNINKISSAKFEIIKIAGTNNNESFNTAIAILNDKKIIDPSDYNVFLNVGDRSWSGGPMNVRKICDLVQSYCRRNGFNVKDMFISCLTQLNKSTEYVNSNLDKEFDSYGVNTIKIGKEDLS